MGRRAKVVAFSTSPEMSEQIDRLAEVERRTRSELLREAFRAYAGREGSSHAAEAPAAYARAAATGVGAAAMPPGTLAGFELVRSARLEIKRTCRARHVRRLWVFGSAVRPDFDTAKSDVDFVVEWLPDAPKGPWLSHLTGLESDLSTVLGRPVDVIESGTASSSRIAAAVEAEKVLVYESP